MKKRLICCVIVMALCLSVFAGCATSFGGDDLVAAIKNLEAYVRPIAANAKTSYDVPNEMGEDYYVTDAKGNPATIYVQWKVEGSFQVDLTNNGKTTTVNVPTNVEVDYTLKATLVNEKGKAYLNSDKETYTISILCSNHTTASGNQGGTGGNGGNTGDTPGTGGQQPGTGDQQQPGTGDGNNQPQTPTEGNGTQSSPYTVAQALSVGNALSNDQFTDSAVYVKGIVVAGSTSQGATPYKGNSGDWKLHIADTANGTTTFYIYFATPASGISNVTVGDTVLLYGYIEKYNNQAQMYGGGSSGKTMPQLVSVTAGSGNTGGNQGGGDSGDNGSGEVTGNTVTFIMEKQGFTDKAAVPSSISSNGITIAFNKGTGGTAPSYYTNNGGNALRLYAGNTMTISGKTIVKVVLTFATEYDSNTITTNVGTFATNTWTGSTDNLTFTIGGDKGNRRVTKIEVTFAD